MHIHVFTSANVVKSFFFVHHISAYRTTVENCNFTMCAAHCTVTLHTCQKLLLLLLLILLSFYFSILFHLLAWIQYVFQRWKLRRSLLFYLVLSFFYIAQHTHKHIHVTAIKSHVLRTKYEFENRKKRREKLRRKEYEKSLFLSIVNQYMYKHVRR